MWRESSEVERAHNRSAHERWKWMEDRCWMQGVQRSAGQCQDKWEGITAGFKKVNDYEKQQLAMGQPSYWQLGSDDKKKLRLPPNFHKEVFAALQEWYVKSRTGDPPGVLFDALAPCRGAGQSPSLIYLFFPYMFLSSNALKEDSNAPKNALFGCCMQNLRKRFPMCYLDVLCKSYERCFQCFIWMLHVNEVSNALGECII